MRYAFLASLLFGLAACTGGGSSDNGAAAGGNDATDCSGSCVDASSFLTPADVRQIISQAVAQARALNVGATIAVVDRVGNVLAIFRMNEVLAGGDRVVTLVTNPGGPPIDGGVERLQLPVSAAATSDGIAALAKAVTGAYLSSEGNAFTTRTANQIVQRNFNPGEINQPSGPLFGVQFSQLPCSDFSQDASDPLNTRGPKRSPLGLSADPGGFPLYKNGTPVGGVGVISDDFIYGIDPDISDFDSDPDELIALAGVFGFAAPADREASRITVEGKTLRFSDVDYDAVSGNAAAAPLVADGVDGELIGVRDYYDPASGFLAGQAFGQPGSGIRADMSGLYPGRDAFVFVDDANANRYPPTAGSSLTAEEVRTLIDQALGVANAARAQIRRPLGSAARVTISVVDTDGTILGMARTRDAPVFGAGVSLQKARTATLFSSMDAGDYINALPDAQYLTPDLMPSRAIVFADYVDRVRTFFDDPTALANGIAFADRSGGNISRPNFPDGIEDNPPGPLSKPPGEWSPFSTGLQLDLSFNAIVSHLLYLLGASASDVEKNCVGVPFAQTASTAPPRIANGIQIFPGSVPVYKGNQLVGGIGVSGDGIDQDDMISFLGVHRAGQVLGTVNNAPPEIRADTLTPKGVRLRYINCPQSPFNDSEEQNVCAGK
ncbi:MAG: hypothetical protein CMN28_16580 [Salinisphaeraceae bacterium]|nr:hypothetical protein [Salinisphaeraceae bacterium]